LSERVRYPRVSSFKSAEAFRSHLASIGVEMDCDDEVMIAPESPLSDAYSLESFTVGNRFCIQPMEGWDATEDGHPTGLTRRRWRNFGLSGAKLIWGGEAFAVVPEGRANPNQLMARPDTQTSMEELRQILLNAHREVMDSTDDLLLGLQLTHSGRFCRPFRKDRMEPAILYRHPILDSKFGLDKDYPLMEDSYIDALVGHYVRGAKLAWEVGYQFVDVKHCHGYLGHEFLSAYRRPGPYGGSFENRTRFAREIIEGIRSEAPGLQVGVRLSVFDFVPFRPDPDGGDERLLGSGIPEDFTAALPYEYGFGIDPSDPLRLDLNEGFQFIDLLSSLGVELINISCGSPYYNPHIQRPALFPPSDGYQPPEDPLVGVARQLNAVAAVKDRFPQLAIVGSGYSYLQEFLPHVAQHYVRANKVDFPGLGRMVLSYPELPRDVIYKGEMVRKMICRTFSDCTTAPRNGIVSGCFPLDRFYKKSEGAQALRALKAS
jgi:2,4-dienoyl-CoA reductase-like NADH-dependent reductase (Old Yellow Enzyme family)